MRWCWFLMFVWMLGGMARADVRSVAAELSHDEADTLGGALEQRVRDVVGEAGGQGRVFLQGFLQTRPVVWRLDVRDPAGGKLPVEVLEPMGGQTVTLAEGDGPRKLDLVYANLGRLQDYRGTDLAGKCVALEIAGGAGGETAVGWKRAASLGAAAVMFLGSPETGNAAFLEKSTSLPLALPRLYCQDVATVERIRKGELKQIACDVRTGWDQRRANNVVCVLPARGKMASAAPWMVLQTRYEGSSPVMGLAKEGSAGLGLAVSATADANAAALLDVAQAVARSPDHAGVVLVWTVGDQWNGRGTREFLELLEPRSESGRERAGPRAVAALDKQAAEARRGGIL